ncbi:BON domain-containing protein [Vibrio sp.]|uniref:BON domain-containing protein n=1 Tax=Vibrio viridaestus TaxID=2487322 RepID=A0A3N9U4J0_9VIBR|nr:BON domain-containing protein [Vibrio viridaestus]MDC0609270.1 BON domain-containing protein [Vibrio sp.]RQW62956.1 BON domain-containing protein [Vibrio viridaestus]
MKNLTLLITLSLVLMLSGCVGLFIAGSAATVNYVTDPRTTQQIWDDNYIESEITGVVKKPPYRGKTRIIASSFRGSVILMGQAPDEELLQSLENDVRQIKGVKDVYDQVRIKEPLTTLAIGEDSVITTKVKTKLLTDHELSGVKIKVITEDKEVFLLGYVTHKHADKATEIARNVSGVKKVIRAFQYGD